MPNNARKTAGYTISDKEITESIPELKCHAPLIAASISFKMIPAAREGTPVHNQNFNVPGSPSRLRVLKSLKAYAAPVICPVSNSKAKKPPDNGRNPDKGRAPESAKAACQYADKNKQGNCGSFFHNWLLSAAI